MDERMDRSKLICPPTLRINGIIKKSPKIMISKVKGRKDERRLIMSW
jgi:hypothetical protein